MRLFSLAFAALVLIASPALACRDEGEPSEMKSVHADAIVLTSIKDVRPTGSSFSRWAATASVDKVLWGATDEQEISFQDFPPGYCERIGQPKLGRFYVLYLTTNKDGYWIRPVPFWWAWNSGDPRLAKLIKLKPLGNVRQPTAEEARMLDLAEPRVKLPRAGVPLRHYTRIYARSSAGIFRAVLLRSRTPQQLMVDYDEEMPTDKTCGCHLSEQFVDLDDLEKAGKLAPFNP